MTTTDWITRLRTDRRSEPRQGEHDRRGRVPQLHEHSQWVDRALANELPAGGPIPTWAERITTRRHAA